MNLLQKLFTKEKPIQIEESKINYNDVKQMLYSVLYNYINTEYSKWHDETKCPLKGGDVVILDKYNINKGNNGWDSGASGHDLKYLYPFNLEITEVFADKSLEKVDLFLNNISYDHYLKNNYSIKKLTLLADYKEYCQNRILYGLHTDNIYGFYFSAKYKSIDPNIKIPHWCLNIKSFIKAGTDSYNKTKELWKTETDLYFKDKELREVKKDFDAQRETFYLELNKELI